jgi:hypothetical protein
MTQTRSGKIADTKTQASRRGRPNLATEHAKRSNSASTAAIADAAEKTTKDHAANNPLPSAIEDPASSDPAPTNSTTSAASTYDTNGTAEQDALLIVSTQLVNTAPAPADTASTSHENTVTDKSVTSTTENPEPNNPRPAIADAARDENTPANNGERRPTRSGQSRSVQRVRGSVALECTNIVQDKHSSGEKRVCECLGRTSIDSNPRVLRPR